MKIFFAVFGVAIVLLSAGCAAQSTSTAQFGTGTIEVHGATFVVEVADTVAEREQGLQNRESLAPHTGMLFVFPEKVLPQFWMKNTLVALDILWVANGKVVDISEQVLPQPSVPDSQLKRYAPRQPIDQVVEIPAGTAASIGILVGDLVVLQAP